MNLRATPDTGLMVMVREVGFKMKLMFFGVVHGPQSHPQPCMQGIEHTHVGGHITLRRADATPAKWSPYRINLAPETPRISHGFPDASLVGGNSYLQQHLNQHHALSSCSIAAQVLFR